LRRSIAHVRSLPLAHRPSNRLSTRVCGHLSGQHSWPAHAA
jgi:hypothetical protein